MSLCALCVVVVSQSPVTCVCYSK